jgi:hypothetical protein
VKVGIPLVIKQLGDEDAGLRASAVSVMQWLAVFSESLPYTTETSTNGFEGRFDHVLSAATPSIVERLGDGDTGIRGSALAVVQSMADRCESSL